MQVSVLLEEENAQVERFSLNELVLHVLEYMKCPKHTDVTITFVSKARIHELNREYRGIDRPTDVLSFECDNIPFEDEDIFAGEEYELGDVIIAADVAIEQAQEYGTTLEEEITLLIVHGLLHLLGYDHVEDEDAEEMENLERTLIASWKEVRRQ